VKNVLIALLGVLTISVGSTHAADYEITEVIEIGPAAQVLSHGSVKWSPDGTMLAYFADNFLMISDTLGNSREVVSIPDMYPFRFQWVSNHEIVASLKESERRSDSTLYQLTLWDIDSGSKTIIQEVWRTRSSLQPGKTCYQGPFLTLEGNAYYESTYITGDTLGGESPSTRLLTELKSFSTDKQALRNDHILRRGDGGLYKVSLGDSDSILIMPKPDTYRSFFSAVRADGLYVADGCYLHGVQDGTRIRLDTLNISKPPSAIICGFSYVSFNSHGTELLGIYYCEDSDKVVMETLCAFNYSTGKITDLGSLLGLEGGIAPVYSPDGRKIALTAEGKAYIIVREGI